MSDQDQYSFKELPLQWWAVSADALTDQLKVTPENGLSPETVTEMRNHYGNNQIEDRGPTSLWTLLWESIKSPMMLVLVSIAVISLVLGQYREAIVMVMVVAIYIGVHLLNKARSDRTMARLREVQAPKTAVIRAGKKQEIDVEEVVVGDILPLSPGSHIPADARLISSVGLRVNEAALTGESAPVQKDADANVSQAAPLAERGTAIFAGTTILDGQGKALVIAVGGRTELGKIKLLVAKAKKEKTPLQKEMDDLARTLTYVAIGVSLLIPLVGLLRGFDLEQMILTWLSLTFLMVPGQPPIIIAMALALAALELARKGVIVRQLNGAETLGSVNVILSDKTGTMTENVMTLTEVLLPNGEVVEIVGRDRSLPEAAQVLLDVARLAIPENTNDPTDKAILSALDTFHPRCYFLDIGKLVDLQGFSRDGRYRRLRYECNEGQQDFYAGRPEYLLNQSDRLLTIEKGLLTLQQITDSSRERLSEQFSVLANQGKRISAYAYRIKTQDSDETQDLIFAGAGIITDPIRPEVAGAVETLKGAGIRTVMVTGDITETAAYVARQVGIDAERVVAGSELEKTSNKDLNKILQEVNVFARTTPEQKFRLVKILQDQNQVVAVTGDGVNDAPALKAAQVGIAMGEKGTDVAREAADLILTDDNFAHLPDGVAIGRKAYDNFRKGITYYLSAKAILLTIFIVPLLVGKPFPLAPIQIIFTELLMDLASSTIFVSEEAEPDVMFREPRQRKRFLSWEVGRRILQNMAGLTIIILGVYFGSLALGFAVNSARTAAFSTWLLGHIVLAMNLKQEKLPLFKQGLLSNKFAAGWLVGMVAFVLAITLWPFAQSIFNSTGLTWLQWVMVVSGALLASMWIEVAKWLKRKRGIK